MFITKVKQILKEGIEGVDQEASWDRYDIAKASNGTIDIMGIRDGSPSFWMVDKASSKMLYCYAPSRLGTKDPWDGTWKVYANYRNDDERGIFLGMLDSKLPMKDVLKLAREWFAKT